MSLSTQEELLFYIERLSAIHKDQRLGQLMCNLVSLVDLDPEALWTADEASLCLEVESHYESQLHRLGLSEPPLLRSGQRLDLLSAFRHFLDRHPEKTIGQSLGDLVAAHAPLTRPAERSALVWDIEDDELLRLLRLELGRSPASDPGAASGMAPQDYPSHSKP
jgi:hypothetical protein